MVGISATACFHEPISSNRNHFECGASALGWKVCRAMERANRSRWRVEKPCPVASDHHTVATFPALLPRARLARWNCRLRLSRHRCRLGRFDWWWLIRLGAMRAMMVTREPRPRRHLIAAEQLPAYQRSPDTASSRFHTSSLISFCQTPPNKV